MPLTWQTLPRWLLGWIRLGWSKFAALFALVLLSCAHVDPLIVTGDSLDLVEHSVVTTYNALLAADKAGHLSKTVVDGWNKDFYPRYLATYHTACDTWRVAVKNNDATKQAEAAAIISTIASDLARYSALVMLGPALATDGGTL